jgi:hypothetical protein
MSTPTIVFFTRNMTTWEEDNAECRRRTIEYEPPLDDAETHPWRQEMPILGI